VHSTCSAAETSQAPPNFREVDYNQIFKLLLEIRNSSVEVPTEPKRFEQFPFSQAYKGQNQAIEEVIKNERTLLCSPTGTGKTLIFGTAALVIGAPTIIIEPRCHLQTQVCEYDFLNAVFLKARHRYPCKLNYACRTRFKRNGKWYFYYRGELMPFPCSDCVYEQEKRLASSVLKQGGIVVLNQGNFWLFREDAEFVVVDEADEFVRHIVSAISFRKKDVEDKADVEEIIEKGVEKTKEAISNAETLTEKLGAKLEELRLKMAAERSEEVRAGIRKEIEEIERELAKTNRLLDRLQNDLKRLYFFRAHAEDCFVYEKGGKVYVEMYEKPGEVINRLFKTKTCVVTATPFNYDGKKVYYDVPFKAKVFVLPIGNLTVRNVFWNNNQDLLYKAAEVIKKIALLTFRIVDEKKAVVHCGNLKRHGKYLHKLISFDFPAILHEEGKLEQTIAKFLQSDTSFLLAVGMEYGTDLVNIPLQFILKVPYAAKDERLKALEKFLGRDEFEKWYSQDALNRIVQACGRTARRPNDFSVTFILDEKFVELYEKYEHVLPGWFKNRLVWLKLKDVGE